MAYIYNSDQIDQTDYYRLPSGDYLEDYIDAKGLSFAMGSALKYRWRAGKKHGEPEQKALAKYTHYCQFIARCQKCDLQTVQREVATHLNQALVFSLNKE